MGWLSKISGLFSFILQALVVIAAVLLFSYLDPFGWLGSKKKTLEHTPVTITSIKEIGQLISAEYYGEVVSSLNEKYLSELDENSNQMKMLDTAVSKALREIHAADINFKKRKSLQEYFNEKYSDITRHPFYEFYIDYMGNIMGNIKGISTEKGVLDKLYDKNYQPSIRELDESKLSKKSKDYFLANKKDLKKQIVLIGRGTVQAGYDFGTFSEKNFKYNANTNIIYFIGLHPEILSCHINPWFIPERNVKGFEILIATGKANHPRYIQSVKQDCLDKLRSSALQQQILEKAQASARETLKNFFSLLLNAPVRDVIFLNKMSDYYEAAITADGTVSDGEVILMDSVYQKIYTHQWKDTTGTKTFIESVKKLPLYIDKEKRNGLNVFSSYEYTFSKDWVIDSTEYQKLRSLQDVLKKKTAPAEWAAYKAWYTMQPDSLALQYQQMLQFLGAHTNKLVISSKDVSTDSLIIRQKLDALKP